MDAVQIIANHVVDLKVLARLPGVRPPREARVERLLVLAQFWGGQSCLVTSDLDQQSLTEIDPLNLRACYLIAGDHEHYWERQHMTKYAYRERTIGRPIFNGGKSLQRKVQKAEIKALSKLRSVVKNMWADIFLGRTSAPNHRCEQSVWPPRPPRTLQAFGLRGDDKVQHDVNKLLDQFRIHQAGTSARVADLITAVGAAADTAEAARMLDNIYSHWAYSHWVSHMHPSMAVYESFAPSLHTMPDAQACAHIIAMACFGIYNGHITWDRLRGVLAQGAWPWLRGGYTKTYAKLVWALMTCLCASVELGYLNGNVRDLLFSLAHNLIGKDNAGGPWRIRMAARLVGPKVKIAAVAPSGEETQTEGKSPPDSDQPWNLGTLQVPPRDKESVPANHIIPGEDCNHGTDLTWTGRVRLAHSLHEVAESTKDGGGLTVALTRADQPARDEVEAYAVAGKILSVKRGARQCMSCVCKVGFVSSALLVIE